MRDGRVAGARKSDYTQAVLYVAQGPLTPALSREGRGGSPSLDGGMKWRRHFRVRHLTDYKAGGQPTCMVRGAAGGPNWPALAALLFGPDHNRRLEQQSALGTEPGTRAERFYRDLPSVIERTTAGGRTLQIRRRAMPDGRYSFEVLTDSRVVADNGCSHPR